MTMLAGKAGFGLCPARWRQRRGAGGGGAAARGRRPGRDQRAGSANVDRALHVFRRILDAGAAEFIHRVRRGRRDDVERGALAGGELNLIMHHPAGILRRYSRVLEKAVGREIVRPVRCVVDAQDVGAALPQIDPRRNEPIVGDGDVHRRTLVPVLRRGGGEGEGKSGQD